MTGIPAPNLDDRRFQDLVDDAKRLVQRRCPEWTDHNVSDPGVTLIEAFATMVDQLLYRLNRVPDRHYVHFLELIGTQLFAPVAARTDVTFWLSAPQPATLTVPAGTEVATVHTELTDPVVFTTEADAHAVPCELRNVGTEPGGGELVDHTGDIVGETAFPAFSAVPVVGDALYVGLTQAVPRCVVNLRLSCEIEGIGVDPTWPPLRWEAFTGGGWEPCTVDSDETGGLNRAGDLVLHAPAGHAVSVLAGQRAAWLRCVLVEPEPGQPFYSASPRLHAASAFTVGVTGPAVHAEIVRGELLGTSDGNPGQRFAVQRAPLTGGPAPEVLEVGGDEGWRPWRLVEHFAECGPDDKTFTIDRHDGTVALGPAVRRPDGILDQYGAIPPKGAPLRLRSYHAGGGRRGNARPRALSVLRTSIPYVSRVENRRAASGGVDGEDVENAKRRAPLLLRSRSRAVTAEDYEMLAREAAPGLARVRAAPDDAEPNLVRVLVVPAAESGENGQVPFAALRPTEDVLRRVAGHLDERRTLGARVVVEPPFYRGVTVVARLTARLHASARLLRADALRALYHYLHPLTGGADGTGWPFGRMISAGDVHALLERLPDVDAVGSVRFFAADPVAGTRAETPSERIGLGPTELAYSFEHQVLVE